jgi:two-component system OmpR family response regulator
MSSRPLILIAEDTHDLAENMQRALAYIDIDTHHAANGLLTLEFLSKRHPDILLLDIGMPGKSGWEVLDEIKRCYPDSTFPVIVLTAYGDPANKLVGKLQPRVYRYITKPFDLLTLTSTVQEALESAPART